VDQLSLALNTHSLPLLVFGGIAAAFGAVLMGVRDMFVSTDSRLMASSILRKLPKQQSAVEDSAVGRFDTWLERAVYMTGMNVSTSTAC